MESSTEKTLLISTRSSRMAQILTPKTKPRHLPRDKQKSRSNAPVVNLLSSRGWRIRVIQVRIGMTRASLRRKKVIYSSKTKTHMTDPNTSNCTSQVRRWAWRNQIKICTRSKSPTKTLTRVTQKKVSLSFSKLELFITKLVTDNLNSFSYKRNNI